MPRLKNRFIEVSVAPELGGRIMEFSLSGRNFLFENPLLKGDANVQAARPRDGEWLNYGGEKIWPAPQGWDDPEREWGGPPDPFIDGGRFEVLSEGENFIELASPVEPRSGVQIFRKIEILDGESRVKISAKLFNRSEKAKRWSLWPVAQMAHTSESCEASVPAGASGWKVMHGLVNNPQYVFDGGILRVKCMRIVGKAGALAPAGWTAFGDPENGRLFAASFKFDPSADYPDSTSVQIWTSGEGAIYSRKKLRIFGAPGPENPAYTELEILSPLSDIRPGGFAGFEYFLGGCETAKGESVRSVSGTCAVVSRLQKSGENLFEFSAGFFREGELEIRAASGGGETPLFRGKCSPVSPVCARGEIPRATRSLTAKFFDSSGNSETIDSIKL